MQIVIDIPQDIYELCKRDKLHYEQAELLEKQVANGTPLPKVFRRGEGMKSKYDIFIEYCIWKFGEDNEKDTILEYIVLSNTIDFQSYLAQYRLKEIFQILGGTIMDLLKGMRRGIKYWVDLFIH